ncbi:MAG: hypothetical protein ACLUOB_01560 [Subdoligranulum sp.]
MPTTLCPTAQPCTVRLPESALKQTEGVTFEAGENGTTIIRGWGKSGHAAMPQGTVNAIGLIVTCLLESKVCSPAETTYLQVLAHPARHHGRRRLGHCRQRRCV